MEVELCAPIQAFVAFDVVSSKITTTTASYKGNIIFVLKTKEYGELCRITSQLLTDGRWVEDTKAVLVDDKRVPCNVRLEREEEYEGGRKNGLGQERVHERRRNPGDFQKQ